MHRLAARIAKRAARSEANDLGAGHTTKRLLTSKSCRLPTQFRVARRVPYDGLSPSTSRSTVGVR